ncbi:MAG: LCP family protein [Candidatus Fimivivens sp.]
MEQGHSKIMQFCIAFMIGILVLAIPFSFALFRFAGNKITIHSQPASYYPQSSDAITLTVALRENIEDKPNCILLCRVDPLSNAIKIAVIPPETMVEDAGKFDVVAGVWHKEGADRAQAALESALSVESDRWMDLTADSLLKLSDVVGAIDFTLDASLWTENGLPSLPQGRQIIDGRKAALLINYQGYAAGEQDRLKLVGALTEQMLLQRMPLMTESLLVQAFETAVNNGYSNMAVGDFESRRRALTHMMSRSMTVEILPVKGEYNEGKNTFLPSAETQDILSKTFHNQDR